MYIAPTISVLSREWHNMPAPHEAVATAPDSALGSRRQPGRRIERAAASCLPLTKAFPPANLWSSIRFAPRQPNRRGSYRQAVTGTAPFFAGASRNTFQTTTPGRGRRMDSRRFFTLFRVSKRRYCGLYCRMRLPSPSRRSVFPQRTLHERQVQKRLAGEVSPSQPFT